MKIGELFVRLSADTGGLKRGMAEADTAMNRFGATAKRVGLLMGAGLFAGVIKNSIEAQNAIAQLNAVVKSTGGAAGFATPQLTAMASELQKVSTFSDEAIMGAQGLLLTFTRIKGAEFQGATQAVMNLAQAMGGDLKGAAIQVGKALNDPVRGLTALRKAGIQFSESQTATIKKLVETGQIAEAQRVILKELEVQFGGSAAAARNTLGGALTALKNAFGDALEASGEATAGITGALNRLADWMPKIREKFGAFFGGVEMMLVDLAITWQENFLKMRGVAASFLEAIGGSFSKSLVPKIREWGKSMLDTAAEMRAGVGMTRTALEAWRTEQNNLIAGLNATVAPVKTVTAGVDGLTSSTDKATAAAKKLAATLKDIGGLDFASSFERQAAKIQEGLEALSFGAFGVKQMTGAEQTQDSARVTAEKAAADNFKAFAQVPEEFRKGQKSATADMDTLGSRLKAGLGDIGTDLLRGLTSITMAMLVGGGGRGSQIGSALGGGIGGAIGGAMMGGKLGTAGGPIGIAIGTVVGALGGSLFGGLFDKKKKVASGLDLMAAGLDRVNSAMRNAPSGYRAARSTHDATTPPPPPPPPPPGHVPPPDGGGGGGGGGGEGGEGGRPPFPGGVTFTGNISVIANSPAQFLREIGRIAEQQGSRGGVTGLGLALAGG